MRTSSASRQTSSMSRLKFLQTKAAPSGRRTAGAGQAQVMAGKRNSAAARQTTGWMPATDDEIREKYLERAIREAEPAHGEIQECESTALAGTSCPCSDFGHPRRTSFLLKYAPPAVGDRGGVRSTAGPAARSERASSGSGSTRSRLRDPLRQVSGPYRDVGARVRASAGRWRSCSRG